MACREHTLPRDDPASQAKGWIQGDMRIGLVLEVTTSFQHFKCGIEIRIGSVNQDNSEHVDFSVPRRARYVHSAWKRHQDAVFWVDIDLAIREGLTFYQTRSNAIILQGTLPAHCISKVERLKTGEMLYERRYLSPRPPPKISLKHGHTWTKGNDQSGSTVEQQPVGKLVQQSFGEAPRVKLSKPTQSKTNPICDRTEKLEDTEGVFVDKGKTSRSHEINDKRLHTELGSSDGTGKPVKYEDNRVMHAHDGTGELVKSSANTHSGRICSCQTS